MTHDHLQSAEASHEEPFSKLRAALSGEGAQTPEIVAIFQQIKNLRESDRSLRSIRRNLDLDNMPVIDPESNESDDGAVPSNELAILLDSFLALKREKEALSDRLVQMISAADRLEAKVNQLTEMVERQSGQST
ncbi:MAG TPA: hypothetical protein V6D47_13720 [Oscillatoriaceae cyanobacterium]